MNRSLRSTLMVLTLLAAPAAIAIDLDSADVAGLRIGMTVDEAEAALKKHASDFTIERFEIGYQYSDGAVQLETPLILSRLSAKRLLYPDVPGTSDNFLLVFFGLPGEEVVTALSRSVAGLRNPVTRADFLRSLTGKYGQPTVAFAGNQYATWLVDPGKEQVCFSMLDGVTEISSPLMEVTQLLDVSNCASMVRYSVSADPVTNFYAEVVDAELIVSSYDEVQEWINGLEDAAVKEREANAESPVL